VSDQRESTPEIGRALTAWLVDIAPDREPTDLLDRVLERTSSTRRRPSWWGPSRALGAWSLPPLVGGRAVALAGLVLLLAIAALFAIGVGSRPQLPLPLGRPGLIVVGRDGVLELLDSSGKSVRQVATGEMSGGAFWSRDGSLLAHADGSPTNPFLVISGADLVEHVRIRLPIGAVPAFSWSPDARRIAFATETDTSSQTFVVDVAPGAVPVPIGEIGLHGLRPAWSPDGEWIALRGGVEIDQQALYVVRPDGSGLRRVSQAARAVQPWCGFQWTPDGRSIVFETALNGVWIVDADGGHERVILGGSEQAFCPALSHDGKRVAMVVQGPTGLHLTLMALDGSARVQPPAPLAGNGVNLWSPDDRLVAMNGRDLTGGRQPRAFIDPSGIAPARTFYVNGDAELIDWQRLSP